MITGGNVHGEEYVRSDFTGTIIRIVEPSIDWIIVQCDDGRIGNTELGRMFSTENAHLAKHCIRGARVHGRIAFSKDPRSELGRILRMWPEEHWVITKFKQWFPSFELRTKDPVLQANILAPAE